MKVIWVSVACMMCMAAQNVVGMDLRGMTATTPIGQAMEIAGDVQHIAADITHEASDVVQALNDPSGITTTQAVTIAAETNALAADAQELADDIVDVVGNGSIKQLAQKWALPGAMGVVTMACIVKFLRNGDYALAGGSALVGTASTLYAWYLKTRQTPVADPGIQKRMLVMRTSRERRMDN